MSKSDSAFSKSQLDLLKQFKKQISTDSSAVAVSQARSKTPSAIVPKTVEPEDDLALFHKQMQGVQKMSAGNVANLQKTARKKPNAQVLAKRAAAEGAFEINDAELSDTQAILNPVASQATLSYRIATLQHKVFEDLKAGNLRWFEAVDLHGCTVEDARSAVLQIIQIANDDNQNVV